MRRSLDRKFRPMQRMSRVVLGDRCPIAAAARQFGGGGGDSGKIA